MNDSTVSQDPLLACLEQASGYFRASFSKPAVLAGLPLEAGRLTPALLPRAAERAGLEVRRISPLPRGEELALPALCVLDANEAVLLTRLGTSGYEGFDGATGTVRTVDSALLQLDSTQVFQLRPRLEYDTRVSHLFRRDRSEWFWSTLLLQRRDYLFVVLAALLVNLIALASPLFTMNVYDRVVSTRAEQTLQVLALGMLIVLVFDYVLRDLRARLVDYAGHQADIRLSQKLMEKVLALRMEARPASAGSFASQLGDFDQVREFLTSAVVTALVDLPFVFLFLGVMALIGGPLVLVPMLCIPIALGAGYYAHRKLATSTQESQAVGAQKQALAVETVTALETVKGMAAESDIQYRWERLAQRSSMVGVAQRDLSNRAMHLNQTLQQASAVLVVFFGAYQIFEGQMTMGALIACGILSSRALAPMAQVTGLLLRSARTINALKGLQGLMDKPTEATTDVRLVQKPNLSGGVEFRQVSLRYPNQARNALAGVNLVIRPGERVGVIGRSGSGKSSLLKLILGFYDPSEGSLVMDGLDASQINLTDRRRAIAYVGQDSVLMFGSLRQNILMGSPLAKDEDFLNAVELAGLQPLLRSLPLGAATPVGERGDGFSGGQKQSVLMARALIRKAPMLILDEPTSAMDAQTERALINNLGGFLSGRTLIVATHKPSMLDLVQRLVVVDGGRILADGPKADVLEFLKNRGRQDKVNA